MQSVWPGQRDFQDRTSQGSFAEPLAHAGEDGFITIFRNDAPVAGTSVEMWLLEARRA